MSTIILESGTLSDHTALVQSAFDRAAAAGGGRIVFTRGVYRTGTVHLRSHLHVQLEHGAVWKGSDRIEDYQLIQAPVTSRMDAQPWAVFISAMQIADVLIEGPGTIDGNGGAESLQTRQDNDPRRPYGLHAVGVEGITLRNLTLRDSAFWMQRYHGCNRVVLHGLTVWNHANMNNDGMDIDGCTDVTISDCVIDASDDGICLKSEGALPTRNVVISNCRVGTFASAFKLGTGSLTGFENVAVSNCLFHTSRATRMTHPLNIWRGISAIDLGSVDGGYLRQVSVSNCLVDGYENLFNLRLSARHSRDLLGGQGYADPQRDPRPIRRHSGVGMPPVVPGTLERIRLSGITATGTGPIAANIIGYTGHPVQDVLLRDIEVRLGHAGVQEDIDEAPNYGDRLYPCAIAYTNHQAGVWPPKRWHGLPAYGLVLRHATDIGLENVRFTPASGDPRAELHCDAGVQRVRRDGRILVA